MKHTYHTKMRAVLWAAFGVLCFAFVLASPSAWAQSGCFIDDDIGARMCPVGPDPGGDDDPNDDYSPPDRDYEAERRAQKEKEAQQLSQDAWNANEQGVQAYKKGDWATAISLFQQALQNSPDDPTYRQNLANAQANMAEQQAEATRQRQNKVAADNMQQSIQNFAQTLNAAPVARGLDFTASVPASDAKAKQQAAWKQVHCAASIAKYALAALQTKGDYDEFGTLSVEAFKALDGQRTSVECEQAPAFPNLQSKTVNMDRVIASERQLLTRATEIAGRMKQRGDKPVTTQQPKPPADETPDEKMRRTQRELNEVNSLKITGKTQQEINQQEKDRKELAKIILANNGMVKNLGLHMVEKPLAPTIPKPTPGANKK